MTAAALTAVIGGVGVVIGAAVGAAAGWWTTTLTIGHAERTRRTGRREAAYTEFILSAETFHRVITDWETVPGTQPADEVGRHVAQAAGSVYRSYIAVLLAGSDEAASVGADVDGTARAIRSWFASTVTTPTLSAELAEELRSHLSGYVTLLGQFAEVARSELA